MEKSKVYEDGPEIVELDCGDGATLLLKKIPAGEFLMKTRSLDNPISKVIISDPFYIGITPVTQVQYEAVMGKDALRYSNGLEYPVEVSWENTKLFLQRFQEKTGVKIDLPSEAKWEYACRAESRAAYCFGGDEEQLKKYANYILSGYLGCPICPVKKFLPNAWGLYDMHGNVLEWCEDKWHNDYAGAPTDGSAWLSGGGFGGRVLRGGSRACVAVRCRSACRMSGYEDPLFAYGFRISFEINKNESYLGVEVE